MTIPSQWQISVPLLTMLKDTKIHHVDEITDHLAIFFKLSEDEKKLQKSSGHEGLFHNRIRWSNFYLKRAGLVELPKSGCSKITERGIKIIMQKPKLIDQHFLMQFTEFVDYRRTVRKKSQ